MQLVLQAANVTLLALGSTCTTQAFQQVLRHEFARRGHARVNVSCAAFRLGLEPCTALPRLRPLFAARGVAVDGRCALWEDAMYAAADAVLLESEEARAAAAALLGGPRPKLRVPPGVPALGGDFAAFYAAAERAAAWVVAEYERGAL